MTPALSASPEPEYPSLKWRIPNELLLIAGAALFCAYLAAAFLQNQKPFDYIQLSRGVQIYCNDPLHFVYGVSTYSDGLIQRNFYPAPFYSAFCVPNDAAPQILFLIWMLFPFVWAVILAKQRAAIFAYAPLFLHILLGQSTAFLIPLYYLAANPRPPRWWYGIIIATALFKPHVAAPAVLILLWRWRHHWGAWLTAAVTSIAFLIPTFLHTSNWIQQWLGGARGYEIVSLVTVARMPIRALNMPYVPSSSQQILIGDLQLQWRFLFWVCCGIDANGSRFMIFSSCFVSPRRSSTIMIS